MYVSVKLKINANLHIPENAFKKTLEHTSILTFSNAFFAVYKFQYYASLFKKSKPTANSVFTDFFLFNHFGTDQCKEAEMWVISMSPEFHITQKNLRTLETE